jgi:hypothetical protein
MQAIMDLSLRAALSSSVLKKALPVFRAAVLEDSS